jgi:hypothetical protein
MNANYDSLALLLNERRSTTRTGDRVFSKLANGDSDEDAD